MFEVPNTFTHTLPPIPVSTLKFASNPANATLLDRGTLQKPHRKRDNGTQVKEGPCAGSSGANSQRGVESR